MNRTVVRAGAPFRSGADMSRAWCAYCRAPAVETVPSTPGHVCHRHREEFWRAVIAEVQRRRLGEEEKREEDGRVRSS
jgi:hypothetical protein